MKKRQRYAAFTAIVATSVLLATLLGDTLGGLTGLRSFEDVTLDMRQRLTPESFQPGLGERESEVVLVLFDEFTVLDSIDGWDWISPFPRSHLAELVAAVAGAGARTIGLDVYLGELWAGLNEVDGGDDRLRDAIERAGNVILAAHVEQTDSGPLLAPPHPYFAEVAADVGAADLPSPFETFRDGALAVRSGSGLEPSFALSTYAHSRGLDLDSLLEASRASGRIDLPGLPPGVGEIPAGWADGSAGGAESIVPFRLRFHGPPSTVDAEGPLGTFQASASSDVPFAALVSPELFADKIVLLGTGFHDSDKFRTPFFNQAVRSQTGPSGETYEWMFGVEIHGNAIHNMIEGSYVRPLGLGGTLVLLLALALLAGSATFWKGPAVGVGSALLAIGVAWVVAFWAWSGSIFGLGGEVRVASIGSWVPIATPMLSALLSYVGSVAYVAIVEGREKRFIKNAFGKYLSPDVVAEISEDPSALTLGGEKRPLSLLFSDLEGFTSISEDRDAEELIALLNEYLHDMTQVVFDEGGYLDKYIGDAIMAFWNAPKEVEDHPDRALRAAVVMQRKMRELNQRWGAGDGDYQPLRVRIGVHTGEVVVGNVGGEERFDYSAIGDAVNLASRLEPANKTYDTLNMVSEVTLAAARDEYRVRELDLIAVKGKEEPVRVFELLELRGVSLAPAKEQALEHYDRGLEAYKSRDWLTAKTHFEAAADAFPTDGPSLLYIERCERHIAEPPPPDWDFVVRRTEK